MTRRRLNAAARQAATCTPAHIIKQSPQTEILRHRNGGTNDIIEAILYMDAHSAEWIVTDRVECLRGATDYDTLRNVWGFVRNNLRYRADRPGHERVKSPGALFSAGVGDCKSFSIAEGAILHALGYRYRYRFTAYEPGDFSHVYVVATTPDGQDVILDAVHTAFDEEVPYRRKKDIRPEKSGIQALPTNTNQQPGQPRRWPVLRFVLGAWLAYLILK